MSYKIHPGSYAFENITYLLQIPVFIFLYQNKTTLKLQFFRCLLVEFLLFVLREEATDSQMTQKKEIMTVSRPKYYRLYRAKCLLGLKRNRDYP